MHLWHPTIVHFAIAFFVAAVVTEGLKLFTGKRFWGLVAKYHIMAAAIMSFLAVLSGFADYQVLFMNETGYRFIRSHTLVGFFVFILIQLMANYKFLMEKILPEKLKMVYLIVGGLGVGLVFGASFLGKAAVYSHGAGVTMAMMNYYETEKYLRELYGLDNLESPTRDDSLRAAKFYPGPDTSRMEHSDTLANHEQASTEQDPHHYSIHKPAHLEESTEADSHTTVPDNEQGVKSDSGHQERPAEPEHQEKTGDEHDGGHH